MGCDDDWSNYCSVDCNEHVTGLDVIAIIDSRPDAVVVSVETRRYTPVIPRTLCWDKTPHTSYTKNSLLRQDSTHQLYQELFVETRLYTPVIPRTLCWDKTTHQLYQELFVETRLYTPVTPRTLCWDKTLHTSYTKNSLLRQDSTHQLHQELFVETRLYTPVIPRTLCWDKTLDTSYTKNSLLRQDATHQLYQELFVETRRYTPVIPRTLCWDKTLHTSYTKNSLLRQGSTHQLYQELFVETRRYTPVIPRTPANLNSTAHRRRIVVVAVWSAEHHPVGVPSCLCRPHRISGVSAVPVDRQLVLTNLVTDGERRVFSPVPLTVSTLNLQFRNRYKLENVHK